jgi:hypothetical protein
MEPGRRSGFGVEARLELMLDRYRPLQRFRQPGISRSARAGICGNILASWTVRAYLDRSSVSTRSRNVGYRVSSRGAESCDCKPSISDTSG